MLGDGSELPQKARGDGAISALSVCLKTVAGPFTRILDLASWILDLASWILIHHLPYELTLDIEDAYRNIRWLYVFRIFLFLVSILFSCISTA